MAVTLVRPSAGRRGPRAEEAPARAAVARLPAAPGRVSAAVRALCALLFVAWTGEAPIWYDPVLYESHWRSPLQLLGYFLVPVPGLRLTVWQLAFVLLVPACLLSGAAFRRRTSATYAALAVAGASLLVTLAWGLARGGDPWGSYYQLWRLLVGLTLAALVVAAARSPRDLRALGTTVVAAAIVRGALVLWFYFVHARGKIEPTPAHMTTHEDSLLFVAGIVVMLSWAAARGRRAAWWGAGLVTVHLFAAMAFNNRRLAWIELLAALAFAYLLLPRRGVRRRINRAALLAAPFVLVYLAVGWGRPEPVFAPLRAFATAGSVTDNSSLARLEENRNLVYTLATAGNPLLGTGWGHPYVERTNVFTPGLSFWALYRMMPHNSLLGLVTFGGLVALLGVWLLVPVAAYHGAAAAEHATSAADRAAGMAGVAVLPAFAVQAYGDIGLQMLTCCLLLGLAIGAAASAYTRADLSRRPGRPASAPPTDAAPAGRRSSAAGRRSAARGRRAA
jgi:hypothetical protein